MNKVDYTILNNLATYLNEKWQYELLKKGHVASDALFNSLNVYIEKTIDSINVVGNALFYAIFVENGRRKGVKGVPIEALIGWMRVKKLNIPGERERSVAFAMQTSIKKKGIKPSNFTSNVLSRNDKKIDNDITRFAEKIVDDTINEIFVPYKTTK